MRSGLITQKVGMTRIFNDDGSHLPVTVLKVEDLQVVAINLRHVGVGGGFPGLG